MGLVLERSEFAQLSQTQRWPQGAKANSFSESRQTTQQLAELAWLSTSGLPVGSALELVRDISSVNDALIANLKSLVSESTDQPV